MTQTAGSPQRRRSVSQQWLVNLLDAQLAEQVDRPAGEPLTIIDLGGGTGAVAAHLAGNGHQVTVIDPSPDQLANTDRRARERGVTDRVTTIQGDTETLTQQIAPASVDAVLCHHVLYDVTDRAGTMTAIGSVLRPRGVVSILLKQAYQHLLRHVIDGDLASARGVLEAPDWLDRAELTRLLSAAGFTVLTQHGVGAIADAVRATDVDQDELLALEEKVAARAEWLDAAASLHILARHGE